MTGKEWQDVPIPFPLSLRVRDRRGFPIPFTTLMRGDEPDFTALDAQATAKVIKGRLCGLCGSRLASTFCFVGGPISVSNKAFLDPPMHVICAEYALQVCPYLAMPTARYSKPAPDLHVVPGVADDRPERFALFITDGFRVARLGDGDTYLAANDPLEVQWHEHG